MEKKYPYLAKNTVDGKTYVVFFIEPDNGVVLHSEITDNPHLRMGVLRDFDESVFEILPPDVQVSIHN